MTSPATRTASTDNPPPQAPDRFIAVLALSVVIGLLALVAAAIGLLSQAGEGAFLYTTIRGEQVEINGRGIYYYDSVLKAGSFRGTDLLTIVLGVPLLAVTALLSWRGSLRARLLLTGTLVYFLYVYATLAVGAAYNDLFLVYVALFGTSLFAFVLTFASIEPRTLAARFSARLPRRGPAAFMFFAGLVTLVIWSIDPVGALLQRQPPQLLENSTTLVTHALDLAIIVPAAFLAGVLILRRAPLGYLIAFALLVLAAMLPVLIAAQSAFQLAAGVTFTTAEIVGPIGGFAVVGLLAIWIIVSLLRENSDN